jgi:predicted SnoaL-like aldol condensation-catalyzing enzyme
MRKLFFKPVLLLLLGLCTLAANAQKKRNLKQEDANKKLVEIFFHTFYNDKDVKKSRAMMRPDFMNHHPGSGKGAEETLQAVDTHLFGKYPQFRVFIKRMAAEGDLVWIQCYTQNTPDDRGNMSMDIFRVQDGKIAEHWDIIEAVPEGVDPASMYK